MALRNQQMGVTAAHGGLLVLLFSWNGIDSVADQLRDLSFVSDRISFGPVGLH